MGEMFRKVPPLVWLAVPLICLLYFYNLGAAGMLGPDEPRYAAIGREMARSGDWITPRLWGQPWFEKPALLYWMTGAGFKLGLGPDLAPCVPVVLLSVAFLVFYWWILRREFGCRPAWFSVLILGTAGMWLGFSQVGVTDLPLAATFSAAMLLALPWVARKDSRLLPVASAMLGLAVLAKGLVPLVLAAPLALGLRRVRDLLSPRIIVPFLLVALPWYVLCTLANGRAFLADFFWKQHFERFSSPTLAHGQPWWFYLPVLAAALLPWTPLLALLFRREPYRDVRRLFLLAWLLFGLVFFSAATNKLAGYVLPLLPAAAALMALALEEARRARAWLAVCALLLAAYWIAAPMIPVALESGLSHAPLPAFQWTWLFPLGFAAAAWLLDTRSRRLAAVFCVAVGVATGTVWLKHAALPEINRTVSPRGLWDEISSRADHICVDQIGRDWRYGLNYYSVEPLPDCSEQPRPLWLRQAPGQRPALIAAPSATDAAR